MSANTDVYLKSDGHSKEDDVVQYVTTKEMDSTSKNVKTGDLVLLCTVVLIAIIFVCLLLSFLCKEHNILENDRKNVWRKSDN